MWHDNETERDFLNFGGVSGTVAEMISQASGHPIAIGVSGSWGVGKSSMIKLIRRALEAHPPGASYPVWQREGQEWRAKLKSGKTCLDDGENACRGGQKCQTTLHMLIALATEIL